MTLQINKNYSHPIMRVIHSKRQKCKIEDASCGKKKKALFILVKNSQFQLSVQMRVLSKRFIIKHDTKI